MDFSLLNRITAVTDGIVVTVLETKGHTYRKKGAKALFSAGKSTPVWGNLGSLCVDQEIDRQGKEALAEEKPRLIEIDTSDADDVDFGYGTYCGGVMHLLLEPVLDSHKAVYNELHQRLESKKPTVLVHNFDTGEITLADFDEAGQSRERVFAETIVPPRELTIFGATPLTRRLIQLLAGMEFEIRVADWRPAHLDGLMDLDSISLKLHSDKYAFDADSFVLVQSHDYRRDKEVLKAALSAGSAWVGMLSSRSRRDKLYEELRAEGVASEGIDRISSPVGVDIGAKNDAEIAVSIAAELVAYRNK